MAVLPECQGKGVAEALLRAAEDELRRRGCTCITLDTTAPLQRAIRFYERHGYRASGKVGDHFGMPLYEYVKGL
jgi:ribosomal protein S18 acetylase RimI-like enzyme